MSKILNQETELAVVTFLAEATAARKKYHIGSDEQLVQLLEENSVRENLATALALLREIAA